MATTNQSTHYYWHPHSPFGIPAARYKATFPKKTNSDKLIFIKRQRISSAENLELGSAQVQLKFQIWYLTLT